MKSVRPQNGESSKCMEIASKAERDSTMQIHAEREQIGMAKGMRCFKKDLPVVLCPARVQVPAS